MRHLTFSMLSRQSLSYMFAFVEMIGWNFRAILSSIFFPTDYIRRHRSLAICNKPPMSPRFPKNWLSRHNSRASEPAHQVGAKFRNITRFYELAVTMEKTRPRMTSMAVLLSCWICISRFWIFSRTSLLFWSGPDATNLYDPSSPFCTAEKPLAFGFGLFPWKQTKPIRITLRNTHLGWSLEFMNNP